MRVYSYMAAGLAISRLVAYLAASTRFYQQIAGTPLIWIVMLAPLGMVLLLDFGINRMSIGAAFLAFWAFPALMGLSLAGVFLVITGASIATFAAMSLCGYTTGSDLSRFGAFLFMGLVGIVICQSRQYLYRLECAGIRDLRDRRHRVRRAHRVRYSADEAGMFWRAIRSI